MLQQTDKNADGQIAAYRSDHRAQNKAEADADGCPLHQIKPFQQGST